MRVFSIAALAGLALGACSPLTSNHPLFSVADQTGPAPLTEGVWTLIDETCTREMTMSTPLPRACNQLTLHRAADGGWRVSASDKDEHGVARSSDLHLIIAPAVPTANGEAYAPLYVIELSPREVDAHSTADANARIYALIAPIGAMPAREAFFESIDCDAALREGPIDGVTLEPASNAHPLGCIADTQAGVREAARRATIEELTNIDQSRLVFVHP